MHIYMLQHLILSKEESFIILAHDCFEILIPPWEEKGRVWGRTGSVVRDQGGDKRVRSMVDAEADYCGE